MDDKASAAYKALERMLLDEDEAPTPMKLPLSLLEAITNNFSDEQVLGRGGFAVVYKGMLGNKPVAVKKLLETIDVDEEKFKKEMHCLMNLRHKNVVRFLGYCDETQQKSVEYDGKPVIADQRNRLLCFEFVPKCLKEHITAASCGLEWRVRYQIIKGICDALHYLHEKRIVHADLKPANILLDDNMLPKIADFGLSRCFDEDQSKAITSKLIGSIGYLPQEFFDGHITLKLDIYSLGVIINEMLTGNKATSAEENVLKSWNDRLEMSERDIPLQQVRACAEIAKMCTDPNKANRPSAHRIIEMLELGSADKFDEAGTSTSLVAQAMSQVPKPPAEVPIPEHEAGGGGSSGAREVERELDKRFGYDRNFAAKYELGEEVGRGHFGHTCLARARKGDMRGQTLAVKVISKAEMTTAISIEDVRREVKILKALSGGHSNLVKFFDACEDALNVYIIMELCEGGELLDRILSRGGRYNEGDAKIIVEQILNVVAFCHLQGVVHRDLKPENFLFSTKDEHSPMKIIDFGLSVFIRPDERLNDIVGSAYYVAPEVLHRSYSTEADMWSIGVITYILLCGSRPFWARSASGIFRSVLRADPNFDVTPWQSVSPEAKDFVKRLFNKDYRKRMTAAQALSHPWLRDERRQIPLDMLVFKLVKAYLRSTPLKRAALKALSRAVTEDELIYIRAQYNLLEPNSRDGRICTDNFRMALLQNSTDAMKESRTLEILYGLEPLANRRMDFEEFRAATISPYQLEAVARWEEIAITAFEYFEQEGNRAITIEELAQEMNLSSAAYYSIVRDWIRPSDGKLSLLGYTNFLHGLTMRQRKAATTGDPGPG